MEELQSGHDFLFVTFLASVLTDEEISDRIEWWASELKRREEVA